MKFGALLMPSHPPERSVRDGQLWDLHDLDRLDALGFEEAWIGEHFTAAWEPCPAPDLLIAQALLRTRHIRLGSLGHLLPFHQPVELAHRVAYLDHMAEGRYQLGVGIGVLPTDHALFALDASHGRNRRMTFEAIDMMTRLWTDGAGDFQGEFWSMGNTRSELPGLGHHLAPYQKPHPPIAIAGLTPGSENHRLAGEKGYIPVSLGIDPDASITAQHWDAVVEGGARSGRTPDRHQWRIIRDVYAAALSRPGTRPVPEARPFHARRGRRSRVPGRQPVVRRLTRDRGRQNQQPPGTDRRFRLPDHRFLRRHRRARIMGQELKAADE
jgi:alkanesulfonate monooxygenase SsuD/methylene tetrahydromethanopterin reductase-like flavin-dependent oxidoreductase (luciferase family)